jgi:crotonobetainyl-CoA:carnitine CoA-transferase CaiB-like acyl-CoA transferase
MGTRHPNIAPYGDTYLCADGQILLLAVGTERQFSQLCRVLGLEHLLEHPDYQTNKFRVVHRNTLNQLLEAKISHFQLDEIMEQLQAAKVPAARIRNMASVFQLPAAQSMILEETLENGQHTRRMKTIAFKMS